GHVLDERAGDLPAVVRLQVDEHPARTELGVLVGDHLGEPWCGTGDDPGVPVERAIGLAALRTLVDVAADGGDAVGGLILLGQRSFAGELDRADCDGRSVRVELLQRFLGGDDARLIESVLDDLLEVEHGRAVGISTWTVNEVSERATITADMGKPPWVYGGQPLPQKPFKSYIVPRSNPPGRT